MLNRSYSRGRWRAIVAFGDMLYETYPKAFIHPKFGSKNLRPLKVGIGKEIRELYPDVDHRVIDGFFQAYVTSARYLRVASLMGNIRVGLDGEPTGVVSNKDSLVAEKRLQQHNGETDPATSGEDAERHCSGTGKVRYPSAFDAAQAGERMTKRVKMSAQKFGSYKCDHCGDWHWGNKTSLSSAVIR